MTQIWGALLAGALLGIAAPVLADVKTGVDAWQQGDYTKAVSEWRPLAQNGDPDAQFNMGQAYKLGRGVPSDLPVAIDWYRKAAAQGHMRAEDNLGLLLFQQGDRDRAIPYLDRAATRGEPRAQYIVGTALFNGDIMGKDWVRAYALMTRASASGLTQASTSLEQMDKYVPESQRKQGLALAAKLEQSEQRSLASATPAVTRPAPMPKPGKPQVVANIGANSVPADTTPRVLGAKPKPRPVAPASNIVAAPPAAGEWRVQLGAFGEDGRARSLWSQLKGKVSGLSAYQSYMIKAGAVTRLQAGPVASGEEANRLCSRIKGAGADCIPKKM